MALKLARQRAADGLYNMLQNLGMGKIRIYTGAPPANVAAAALGTLLATLTIKDNSTAYAMPDSTPALGPVATGNEVSGIFAETNAPSDLIVANGTAGWFRMYQSDNAIAVLQGTVGVTGSGADMELNSLAFAIGGSVTLTGSTVQLTGVI